MQEVPFAYYNYHHRSCRCSYWHHSSIISSESPQYKSVDLDRRHQRECTCFNSSKRARSTYPNCPQKQLADPEVLITPDANIEIRDTLVLNVPNGRTYQIELPDGSRVYLHPGSRLVYPSCFYGETREVKLSGEAYFVVTKDNQHPFIVTTNRSQTQVLGTEFDVTSYGGQPESVTLITGSVSFKSATLQDAVIITPGQHVTIDATGNPLISSIDTDPYTMWRDGYFYFDQQQLKDVLTELGRYYDVSIESYNQKALSSRVRFICKRDADLRTVINNINLMKICNASMEKDKIIIR